MTTPELEALTDENISKRIAFGDTLMKQLETHGREPILPGHLAREYAQLIGEQLRRQTGIQGDSI